MITLRSQINAEGRGEGVRTLSKIKKPRGVGVGKFDKIKRKWLFVNKIQFYY